MTTNLKFHVGQRFGKLTLSSATYTVRRVGKKKKTFWLCKCDCGKERYFMGVRLQSGKTQSCGCGPRKGHKKYDFDLNLPGIRRAYSSWQAMKERCLNPNSDSFYQYGAKGITVCDRWKSSFDNFLSDMGQRPESTSLGRIDTYGNYEPGNCRWETLISQNLNKRNTVFVEYRGVKVKLKELCEELGKDRNVVQNRLYLGWTLHKALSVPVRAKKKHLPKIIFFQREVYKLKDFLELFGAYKELARKRIVEGWAPDRIVEEPFQRMIPYAYCRITIDI